MKKADRSGVPLCLNCLEPFDERRDFCEHCGAPVSPYLWLDPLKRIYGGGYVYRKLVGGRNRRSVYIVAIAFLVLQLLHTLSAARGYHTINEAEEIVRVRHDYPTLVLMGIICSVSFILLLRIVANMRRDKPPELD